MCDLFFFVPTLPLDYFVPDVGNQGDVFCVATRTPNFFFSIKGSCKPTEVFPVSTRTHRRLKHTRKFVTILIIIMVIVT
jgi:peptidoglycan biosynthesis protein MviN/MurJ (putative lipid II flippase)